MFSLSGQPVSEILVTKAPHHLQFPRLRLEGADMRMLNPVESSRLYHGVVGHVEEGEAITGCQRLSERPVADHVPRQARRSAETVGIVLHAGIEAILDAGAIG